jgi:adenine-specific DNA-methyltransferase
VESARGTTKGGVQQFYPIYVDDDTQKVVKIGSALTPEQPLSDAETIQGATTVFPIRDDGKHMNWGLTGESLQYALENGCVRVTKSNNPYQAYNFAYVTMPSIRKALDGTYIIAGEREDGTKIVILPDGKESQKSTAWKKTSYDANAYGTKLIGKLLVDKRFSFPKSLYSVYDSLKIYLEDKKDAVVLDFFAGSGTTLHAVNLLNAEDGGCRHCILVTNNEVSEDEEKILIEKGYKKGDNKWESLGIAQYVTWPRTVCSIEGKDINGNNLSGDYGVEVETFVLDEDSAVISKKTGKVTKGNVYRKAKIQLYPTLAEIKMADGFVANVKYLKCDWTPRKPEDYLLSNALCLHIREMIELQNAIEIDNEKNVLLLNKDDYKTIILNPEIYGQIENIWVNQNIILNAEELKMLKAKGYRYIPREFFGQELREVAE